MKQAMEYIKKLWKVLLWPILFCLGQFFMILLLTVIFNIGKINQLEQLHPNISESEINSLFQTLLGTSSYQTDLAYFLRENAWIVAIITVLIFLPFGIHYYKKMKQNQIKKPIKKNIFLVILLGISFGLLFNITIFQINKLIPFTNLFDTNSRSIWVSLITSGLLGPIIEEILYRGIIYGKLKTFNRPMMAIILTSVIFGLIHMNPIQILYGFLLSFLLIYVYEKFQTLLAPIILHMGANISVTLLLPYIIQNSFFFNYGLLLLCTLILIAFILFSIQKDKKKIKNNENNV